MHGWCYDGNDDDKWIKILKDTIKDFSANGILCSRLRLWVGYLIYFEFTPVFFYLMFLMDVI